jgi:hypothetical protein
VAGHMLESRVTPAAGEVPRSIHHPKAG